MLSNYNIKYICTIYTHLYTCLTSIPRFALREKVTLRLLNLLFKGVDVVEWSRALDLRLSEWCFAVYQWCGFKSRRGKNKHLKALRSVRLLKLPFKGVYVVEWSRALDVRLSEWCFAVYQWCGFKSRRGKNKHLKALRSNSNIVMFNFQTYIIFNINLVSLVTLRSNGTDIWYGYHLLLDV